MPRFALRRLSAFTRTLHQERLQRPGVDGQRQVDGTNCACTTRRPQVPLHKTPLIDSGPDRLRMMSGTWAQPTAEAPDLAPLTDDRGVPRRSVRSKSMRTIVARRAAVPRQFRHDALPPVIDVPQHDEVSLAGGNKT